MFLLLTLTFSAGSRRSRMLQCSEACCSVLHVLKRVAVCYGVLQKVNVFGGLTQVESVAVCCSVLQCVAVCCSVL